tara:strand:+ start:29383 stop:31530 length:2148 start_codon:yes stop_codon:yes gene_type:complete
MESLLPIATVLVLICAFASLAYVVVYKSSHDSNKPQLDLASFDNLPVGVLISDPSQVDNPIVYGNSAFSLITGYSRSEIYGQNCRFLQGSDTQQTGISTIRESIAENRACTVTLRNYRKDGTLFWNEVTISPIFDSNGQPKFYLGIQQDVTNRQKNAADLVEQNQRLATSQGLLLELVRDASTTLDETLEKYLSVAAIQLAMSRTGIWQLDDKRELLTCTLMIRNGESITENTTMVAADHPLFFSALHNNQIISVSNLDDELSYLDLDLDYMIDRNIGAVLYAPININGELSGVISLEHSGGPRQWNREDREFSRYITDLCAVAFISDENQTTRAKLDEIESLLAEARKIGQLGSFIWYFEDDQLVFSNEIVEVLGTENPIPQNIQELCDRINPINQQEFIEDAHEATQLGRRRWQGTYSFNWAENDTRYCELVAQQSILDGRPALKGTVQDVTRRIRTEKENKVLQQRLLQSEKLETIGTLARGVAHDFNNLLTPLIGYAELLAADFQEEDRRLTYTGQIIQSGLRAKHLIEQLLTFSLHQQTNNPLVDIHAVMEDILQSIRLKIKSTIMLETNLEEDSRTLRANSGQIRQILMNLCLNADAAMKGNGVINVKLYPETAAALPRSHESDDRAFVAIEVQDNGPGIDETYIKHIFEPFFTTQGIGEGSGLGLSVVHGIVKQHGGEIEITSVPGRTAVTIYLPFEPKTATKNLANR